jgi:hypothetical protein
MLLRWRGIEFVLLFLIRQLLFCQGKETKFSFPSFGNSHWNSSESFLTNYYYPNLEQNPNVKVSESISLTHSNDILINQTKFVVSKTVASELLRDFISFHVHFPSAAHANDDHDLTCSLSSASNITQRFLESIVTSCTNLNYFPRFVTRQQISWKPRTDDSQKKTDGSTVKNTTTAAEPSKNTTENATIAANPEEPSSKKTEKIHSFLIFAIILPEHPFSIELLQLLSIISPLYPRITFIIGEIHEFKDLTNKYLVYSFPKLLLFKNGLFMNDYTLELNGKTIHSSNDPSKNDYNYENLISLMNYLMIWTKSFPVSYPLVLPQNNKYLARLQKRYQSIKSYKYYNVTKVLSSYYLKEDEQVEDEKSSMETKIGANNTQESEAANKNGTTNGTEHDSIPPVEHSNEVGKEHSNNNTSDSTSKTKSVKANLLHHYYHNKSVQKFHNFLLTALIKCSSWLEKVPFPYPNTEPFIGTIATNEYHYQFVDFLCFLFSILYVFLRLIMKVQKYYQQWREPEPRR